MGWGRCAPSEMCPQTDSEYTSYLLPDRIVGFTGQ